MTSCRVIRTRWAVAAVALVALALLTGLAAFPSPASADPPTPHLSGSVATGTCAACHRTHTGQNDKLLKSIPQSTVCFSCHDGTGSTYNVASEYLDVSVPANNATTSSFYSHPALGASTHTSARVDEFKNVLNRHAQCSDCHNPHTSTSVNAAPSPSGWLASGSQDGTAGVAATAPLTWKDPLAYEYELCFKCHSRYTQLLTYTKESQRKTDKAAEFDPANESYHPVRAPGKNTTTEMENSLAGGTLWRLTTASTIRCLNCHANGSLSAGAPAWDGKLAPHASQNRGLLLANYRDRDLKPQNEAYSEADFALCSLCHSPAPFATQSKDPRSDTNFNLHGFHMTDIPGAGSGTRDIDTLGAGQGNAICAECHFQLHSTRFAPYAGNQTYPRGVNFAPNVQPQLGQGNPLWSGPTSRTCSLICHGKDHAAEQY
jgi:predicted CXXCH cytochrome family protein